MKAVVLAAGLGTRLGTLTTDRAKPALLVGGRPIVAHVVAHLDECGFDEIAINLHHFPAQIREAVADAVPRITWFEEPDLLGTAGALSQMHDFLASEHGFLVHYGDVVTDHDLRGLLTRHTRRDALMTMLVHERRGSNSVVTFDDAGRVLDFLERPPATERCRSTSDWVNSGIYACSPEILDLVAPTPSDMAADLVPRALSRGTVFAEPLKGFRCAVDSPERLAEAEEALATGRWAPRGRTNRGVPGGSG